MSHITNRANFSGTQLAATISDFNAAVAAYIATLGLAANATDLDFTPGVAGDFNAPQPTNVNEALNQLASRVRILENAPRPYDVPAYAQGTLTNGLTIIEVHVTRAMIFPANFVGSFASAGVPAAAMTVLQINRGATSVGTVTFAAGSATGVIASNSGIAQAFVAGDLLSIVGPAIADTALADIRISLAGNRTL